MNPLVGRALFFPLATEDPLIFSFLFLSLLIIIDNDSDSNYSNNRRLDDDRDLLEVVGNNLKN